MKHNSWFRLVCVLALLGLALAFIVPTAQAAEFQAGEQVIITANQVIPEDLYLSGNDIIVDGVIQGDLIASGSVITVNGVVEGDLVAAASSIILNGKVGDDVRAASAAMTVGGQASVGGDLIYAGYSLETKPGSQVSGEIISFTGQAYLAGEVTQDAKVNSGALLLLGKIGGSLDVQVGAAANKPSFNPMQGVPNMPAIPPVPGGFTLGESAAIAGNLVLTSPEANDAAIPAGQVQGNIQRIVAAPDKAAAEVARTPQPSPALVWLFSNLRRLVSLIVVGLLMIWLLPAWIKRPAESLRARPWPSLGYGLVTALLFPPVIGLLIVVLVLVVLFFAALTLGSLGGSIAWLGIAFLITVLVAFGLILAYFTKLVVSYLSGRWVLSRIRPDLAEKPIWALMVGILILAALLSIPFLGGAINIVITLLGLGTLWLLWQERSRPQPAAAETPAPMA